MSYRDSNYFQFRGGEPYRYDLVVATAAAAEPVTVTEQKTHSRVDISTDDTYIGTLIQAARDWVENHIGRRLYQQTWDLKLDNFPCHGQFKAPYGPWQSITSITYIALDGTVTTVPTTVYGLDADSFEPRIYLKYGQYWPVPRSIQNAVVIRHVCGYATVPEKFKLAIKMLVDHWYTNARGATTEQLLRDTPLGVYALLAQEKQSWL